MGEGCLRLSYAAWYATARDGALHSRGGHPGFAWAMERELMARVKMEDSFIVGGGDIVFADSCMGVTPPWYGAMAPCMQRAFVRSRTRWHQAVQGQLGYTSGRVFHLWHGDLTRRDYTGRHAAMIEAGYDPERDLQYDDNGLLVCTNAKAVAKLEQYFRMRREDG